MEEGSWNRRVGDQGVAIGKRNFLQLDCSSCQGRFCFFFFLFVLSWGRGNN